MDKRHEDIARNEAQSPSCPPGRDTLENWGHSFCERGMNSRSGTAKTEYLQKTGCVHYFSHIRYYLLSTNSCGGSGRDTAQEHVLISSKSSKQSSHHTTSARRLRLHKLLDKSSCVRPIAFRIFSPSLHNLN